MEKIKITEKQADRIKTLKSLGKDNAYILEGYKEFNSVYECLKTLSLTELSLVLNDYYIIKTSFKVGDWYKYTSKTKRVEFIKIEEIITEDDGWRTRIEFTDGMWLSDGELSKGGEKVTEQWKIMLLELEREKPELKPGDAFTKKNGTQCYIGDEVLASDYDAFNDSDYEYFAPVERRIKLIK